MECRVHILMLGPWKSETIAIEPESTTDQIVRFIFSVHGWRDADNFRLVDDHRAAAVQTIQLRSENGRMVLIVIEWSQS